MNKEYQVTAGAEVHCELKSNTKMFSDSNNHYGTFANTNINEIDFAYPGVLPTVNSYAVELALKASLAFHCKINKKMHTRTTLRRKRQKTTDAEERQKLCNDILALSNSIFELKKEVGYCEDIEERTHKIKENINCIEKRKEENQKGKEKTKNECIRFS